MTIKKFLEGLQKEKAPGPSPSFSLFHVIKTLELTAKEGPIGRGKLSKRLGLGEGATRTLIDRLTDNELIATSKPGCSLTKKGNKIWNQFQSIFPKKVELEKSELTLAECNIAVLIKGGGDKVKTGVEQRDAAILTGAKGATTLVFKHQTLIQPGISENLARDFPTAFNQVTRLMELEDNDVVVVGSADTWEKAEYGALAAAWTLIQNKATKE
jgi:predicted transcriptional regulator